MDKTIEKNILDLRYNKYLQYLNISAAAILSYCIAIIIAVFTNQLQMKEVFMFVIVSTFFSGTISFIIFNIKGKLKNIEKEIKSLT
ncbi:hypothetical protein EXS74_02130 [Candidatus Woesearchaeota archaeon]|nr:hypothetical protein [Candidatus Woesearchaeota archaeon]